MNNDWTSIDTEEVYFKDQIVNNRLSGLEMSDVEQVKNTLLESLNGEHIVILGIEIKLASGYRGKGWYSWKYQRQTNTTLDSSSTATPTR